MTCFSSSSFLLYTTLLRSALALWRDLLGLLLAGSAPPALRLRSNRERPDDDRRDQDCDHDPLHVFSAVRNASVTERSEQDRKSTRLNSSHGYISYAVFCSK